MALLSHEEEIELSKRIEAGDEEALHHLIRSNLPLVISIAKQYTHRSLRLTFLGLIQEGNTGLVNAARKYDWRRGTRFSTYATWCIKNQIKEALGLEVRQSFGISLDQHVGDQEEPDSNLHSVVGDKKAKCPSALANASFLKIVLGEAIATLDPNERNVIELSFGLVDGVAYTAEEIAKSSGFRNTDRVRQIKRRALEKLGSHAKVKKLE